MTGAPRLFDGEEDLYKKSAEIITHPYGKYEPHLSPRCAQKLTLLEENREDDLSDLGLGKGF